MFHTLTCVDCHTQARETVQEAKESSQESEDDWEANAESWEDMDAVPPIGPAAAQAKQKVPLHILYALHVQSPPPPPLAPMPLYIAHTTYNCGTGQVSCRRVVAAALLSTSCVFITLAHLSSQCKALYADMD